MVGYSKTGKWPEGGECARVDHGCIIKPRRSEPLHKPVTRYGRAARFRTASMTSFYKPRYVLHGQLPGFLDARFESSARNVTSLMFVAKKMNYLRIVLVSIFFFSDQVLAFLNYILTVLKLF